MGPLARPHQELHSLCLLSVAATLAAAVSVSAAPSRDYTDTIKRRSALDAELQRAQIQARQSLPIFWKHFGKHPGGPADHAVEVLFHTPSGINEGIWVGALQRRGSRMSGQLADEPNHLPGYHMRSAVTFDESQIIDWMFVEGGKHYGYFSTRVLVKLHPEDAANLKAELWDSPLPPEANRKH